MGQGIGNIVAGLFGGVPGAGATMGTVTNIRAGGTTRVSGALRAVILLGTFTVASSRNLVSVIGADIREHEVVIFDFSGAVYLDDSAAMVIEQLLEVARNADTGVIVMGLSGRVAEIIDTLDILRAVPARQVVDGRVQARGIARELLGD